LAIEVNRLVQSPVDKYLRVAALAVGDRSFFERFRCPRARCAKGNRGPALNRATHALSIRGHAPARARRSRHSGLLREYRRARWQIRAARWPLLRASNLE